MTTLHRHHDNFAPAQRTNLTVSRPRTRIRSIVRGVNTEMQRRNCPQTPTRRPASVPAAGAAPQHAHSRVRPIALRLFPIVAFYLKTSRSRWRMFSAFLTSTERYQSHELRSSEVRSYQDEASAVAQGGYHEYRFQIRTVDDRGFAAPITHPVSERRRVRSRPKCPSFGGKPRFASVGEYACVRSYPFPSTPSSRIRMSIRSPTDGVDRLSGRLTPDTRQVTGLVPPFPGRVCRRRSHDRCSPYGHCSMLSSCPYVRPCPFMLRQRWTHAGV